MSFILDALQKDQVEQQPQPVPSGMLPPPSPSPVKRWGLWLLGAALLVNAGVLGWYLLGQQASTTRGSNVVPSVAGAQRELSMAPSSAPPNTTAPSSPGNKESEANRIPKRSPVRNPVAAPTRTSPIPSPRPSSVSTTAPATGAGRVLSPEQAEQMGIGDDLLTTQDNTQDKVADQPSRAALPTTPRTNPPPVSTSESSNSRAFNAITIAQLPAAARNSFPALEFSTHIFADDPSMRAVVVNDTRLTEGEQLGELILRAVTEEGVVFGYRNHLVAVSVVELWAE